MLNTVHDKECSDFTMPGARRQLVKLYPPGQAHLLDLQASNKTLMHACAQRPLFREKRLTHSSALERERMLQRTSVHTWPVALTASPAAC